MNLAEIISGKELLSEGLSAEPFFCFFFSPHIDRKVHLLRQVSVKCLYFNSKQASIIVGVCIYKAVMNMRRQENERHTHIKDGPCLKELGSLSGAVVCFWC